MTNRFNSEEKSFLLQYNILHVIINYIVICYAFSFHIDDYRYAYPPFCSVSYKSELVHCSPASPLSATPLLAPLAPV